MERIEQIATGRIRSEAARLVARHDVDGLGALIREGEERRADYQRQAQEEARLAREAEGELATTKQKLAFLDPAAARQQYVEQQFAVELHAERAKACQAQAAQLDTLIKDLRHQSERVQAHLLAREVVEEAQNLAEDLSEAKRAILPLRETVEKIYTLARRIRDFNAQAEAVRLPELTLLGDPGSVNKLGELKLIISDELEHLARGERKKVAENGSEWQSLP